MTAALLFVAAVVGGAIAALAGFGIGSILTPLLALSVGTCLLILALGIVMLSGRVHSLAGRANWPAFTLPRKKRTANRWHG